MTKIKDFFEDKKDKKKKKIPFDISDAMNAIGEYVKENEEELMADGEEKAVSYDPITKKFAVLNREQLKEQLGDSKTKFAAKTGVEPDSKENKSQIKFKGEKDEPVFVTDKEMPTDWSTQDVTEAIGKWMHKSYKEAAKNKKKFLAAFSIHSHMEGNCMIGATQVAKNYHHIGALLIQSLSPKEEDSTEEKLYLYGSMHAFGKAMMEYSELKGKELVAEAEDSDDEDEFNAAVDRARERAERDKESSLSDLNH